MYRFAFSCKTARVVWDGCANRGRNVGEHDRDDAECCPFNRQRNEDKEDRAVQHSGRAKPGGVIIKALSRPSYSGGCTAPWITVKTVGSVFHPEIQEIKKNKYYRMVIVVNFPGGLGSFRRYPFFLFFFILIYVYNIQYIFVRLFCAGVIFCADENRTYLWKYSLPAFS